MKSLQSVLIAHPNNLLCDTLREVLDHRDFIVQAVTTDGNEALRLIRNHEPMVVLMSNELSGLSGIQVAVDLIAEGFSGKFLLLSNDSAEARGAVDRLTPHGHLHAWVSLNELLYCLRMILNEQTYRSAIVERFLNNTTDQVVRNYYDTSILKDLTPRERDILEALSHSYTTPKIAELFSISVATVNNHRASIMEKLNIKGRNKLLSIALSLRPYFKQVA